MLTIRKAQIKDLLPVYKIANNRIVRDFAFHQDNISIEEHKSWFTKIIKNSKFLYLVVTLDNLCIGYIQFTKNKKNALISIGLDKEYHNKGYGSKALVISLDCLKKNCPEITTVSAHIVHNNSQSEAFFLKNNFSFVKKFEIKSVKAKEYLYII